MSVTNAPSVRPARVFISYAHVDDRLRQQLVKHLSLLRREQLIDDWYDRRILPASDWADEIDDKLEQSDVVLLLISADFMHSDYCMHREMERALELHSMGRLRVIPVLLRPCDWERAEFAQLQALPRSGFPVTSRRWHNQDEAFTSIATDLRELIEKVRSEWLREPSAQAPASVHDGAASTRETDERFADDVGSLYRLFGYRVKPISAVPGALFCELLLRGAPTVRLLVLCGGLSRHVTASDVAALASRAAAAMNMPPWTGVVAVLPNVPSGEARAQYRAWGYRVVGYDELFDELLNLTSVFDAFCTTYEREDIYSIYVPLRASPRHSANAHAIDVHEAMRAWLHEPEQLLVVLGDFGSGKSTLLERFKYELASEFRNGISEFVPLLIPLKHFDAYGPLDAFVEARFQSELDLRLPATRLLPLMRQKPFVFLLDGFDEIALLSDRTQRKRAFAKLVPLLLLAKKAVVTCRPSYFVDDEELNDIFQSLREFNAAFVERRHSLARSSYGDFISAAGTWMTSGAPMVPTEYGFSIVELCGFSETDIKQYVNSVARSDGDADGILSRIRTTYDLPDLAKRPVLLDLIVKTLPMLPASQEASPSVIYETYTGAWLDRDYAKGDVRMLIPAAQKLTFMQELAWQMYMNGTSQIHYRELAPRVREFFETDDARAEHLTTDIQSCSFLERSKTGEFKFAHKSFMEYFVASKLLSQISRYGDEAVRHHNITFEVAFFMGDMIYSARGLRKEFVDILRRTINRRNASESDKREVNNVLRIFGCSRLECDRLAANGTVWGDLVATRVSISGELRDQQWNCVSFASSKLAGLTVTGLQCSNVRMTRCTLTQVQLTDITGESTRGSALEMEDTDWTFGRLSGHVDLKARGGEWREVTIEHTGGLTLGAGMTLSRCTVETTGGAISLTGGRISETAFRGPGMTKRTTAAVAEALTSELARSFTSASFDDVSFVRCLFIFVNFATWSMPKCTFEDCVFLGCAVPDPTWLVGDSVIGGHGNRFGMLSVNRVDGKWPDGDRERSAQVTRADVSSLRLTKEFADQLSTARLSITSPQGPRRGPWFGLTSHPRDAALRESATQLERLCIELRPGDVI